MKIVVDTNTVISAYLWLGVPAQVLELHACGWVDICTCEEQIAELYDVLMRPKFRSRLQAANVSPSEILTHFRQLKQFVEPVPVLVSALSDRKDAWVLGCSEAANARAIISGDKHLLSLRSYRGIPIYRAAEFVPFFDFAKPS